MNDLKKRLLGMVKEDIEKIEASLVWHLTTSFDLVSTVASHLLFSGGKRLRPLLLILSARICGYAGNQDLDFATAFEYLHTATLLHDDVVDEADIRRGKPTAHGLWNSATAVLVGDFLFARASSIAAQTRQIEAIGILANVTEEMSQGELFQLMKKGNFKITEAEYLDVIRRKTAVLFQGACQIGAGLAGAGETQKKALADYGHNLGVSFQIADDLLDYTQQDIKIFGKKAGADLREGKVTLPVIYAIKKADSKDSEAIKAIIENKDFTVDEFEILISLMKKYGGLDYARKAASTYVANAKNALLIFPESETRDILLGFADYALERDS